jgi:transcriptional regulator with XRE-family HTH domain
MHDCVQICDTSWRVSSIDYEALACEVMRALRGRRSQVAFSRRLGYRTNVAYPWESGRRFPTASEMLRAAARVRIDVRAAMTAFFHGRLPDALEGLQPTRPRFVAALLRELRGPGPMEALAQRTGLSRSSISRLLSGDTEPRLPAFFRLVDATSRRLLDLLAGLVDLASLPSARAEWERQEALRRLSHASWLTEAVPRFLELEQYAALPRHEPGWIAARLGIALDDEERTLADLAAAGVTRWDGRRWQLDRQRSIDTTRYGREAARALVVHWAEEGHARLRDDRGGRFAYLVFSTDEATLTAIDELRLRFFREVRALVAASPRNERVAVFNLQLYPIDGGPVPAAAAPNRPGSRVSSRP